MRKCPVVSSYFEDSILVQGCWKVVRQILVGWVFKVRFKKLPLSWTACNSRVFKNQEILLLDCAIKTDENHWVRMQGEGSADVLGVIASMIFKENLADT